MNPNQPDPSGQFTVQTKPQAAAAEYIPFGATEKIKLTVAIIQNLLAAPTRSGKTCSERDAMKFMMLCRSRALDPFSGDAYLVGYDSNDGPTFSLITAHQAFLKRAEPHLEFDGMESGVIISPALACPMCNANGGREVNGNWVVCTACGGIGQRDEIEGDIVPNDHQLVGGWAKVHFKNRKIGMKRRIALKTFNSGYSRWKIDPAGMIVKCAEADALRSSFPTKLGGLYLQEEQPQEMKTARVDVPTDLDVRQLPPPTATQTVDSNAATPDPKPAPAAAAATPKREPKKAVTTGTPISQLRNLMTLDDIFDDEVIEIAVRKFGHPGCKTVPELGNETAEKILTKWDDISAQIRIDRRSGEQPN